MIAYIHILIVLYWIAIRTTKKDSEDKKKRANPSQYSDFVFSWEVTK